MPVDRLSFSAIATFMTCPEQFRVERLEKRWAKRGLSGFVGDVHHRAVADLLDRKRAEPEFVPVGGDLTAVFTSAWEDSMVEEEPEWELKPDDVVKTGLLMLDSFVRTLWTSLNPTGVEVWIEEKVGGVPVPLTGKIDCWEEELTREFKTAKQKTAEPKAKWRMQAHIYQLFTGLPTEFAVTTRQVTPVTWTPETGAPALSLGLADPDTTWKMVVQSVETMNDFYARYGPDETWPLNGLLHQYACNYCPAGPKSPAPTCPAWRESWRPGNETGDGSPPTGDSGSNVPSGASASGSVGTAPTGEASDAPTAA